MEKIEIERIKKHLAKEGIDEKNITLILNELNNPNKCSDLFTHCNLQDLDFVEKLISKVPEKIGIYYFEIEMKCLYDSIKTDDIAENINTCGKFIEKLSSIWDNSGQFEGSRVQLKGSKINGGNIKYYHIKCENKDKKTNNFNTFRFMPLYVGESTKGTIQSRILSHIKNKYPDSGGLMLNFRAIPNVSYRFSFVDFSEIGMNPQLIEKYIQEAIRPIVGQ